MDAQGVQAAKTTPSKNRKIAMISLQAFDTLCLAVFFIDVTTDIIYAVAFFLPSVTHPELSLTDVYSRGCVAIDKA